MRLLLDTHTFLWWLSDHPKLGTEARARIGDPNSIVHVSAASLWEIAIKSSLGRLKVQVGLPALVGEIEQNGFVELPVTARHAVSVAALPSRHTDPFDRLLISQGKLEGLVIVTGDSVFRDYGVNVLPA